MADDPMNKLFNPNEHLLQIKNRGGSADYLPVQWRLVWFRSLCPDGTIETEMVHLDLDRETEEETYAWNNDTRRSEKVVKRAQGFAVFRATIKDGKGGIATGTKSEKAASFPDYIEKAETGAIGRALAALGYGTQFAGDEFDERHRLADAPVEREEKPAESASNAKKATSTTGTATEHQSEAVKEMIRKAYDRAKGIGYGSKEAWAKFILDTLKTQKPTTQWTLSDISQINGELTKREREKQPA